MIDEPAPIVPTSRASSPNNRSLLTGRARRDRWLARSVQRYVRDHPDGRDDRLPDDTGVRLGAQESLSRRGSRADHLPRISALAELRQPLDLLRFAERDEHAKPPWRWCSCRIRGASTSPCGSPRGPVATGLPARGAARWRNFGAIRTYVPGGHRNG